MHVHIVFDAVKDEVDLRVELRTVAGRKAAFLILRDKVLHGVLHDHQGGRFERFDEALRETYRKTVLVPCPFQPTHSHLEMARLGLIVSG